MQRKNRRIFDNCNDFANPAGDGDGVDLNRNFATGFDKGRPQDYGRFSYDRLKQCSMTYGGEEAFSEPETRAIRDHSAPEPVYHRKNVTKGLSMDSVTNINIK